MQVMQAEESDLSLAPWPSELCLGPASPISRGDLWGYISDGSGLRDKSPPWPAKVLMEPPTLGPRALPPTLSKLSLLRGGRGPYGAEDRPRGRRG